MNRDEARAEVGRLGDTIADLRARLSITADRAARERIEQAIRLAEHEQHDAWIHAYK